MLLRNARLYRIPADALPDDDTLLAKLEAEAFHPCTPGEAETSGWTTPFVDLEAPALALSGGGAHLVRLRHQQRILPAAAIDEVLAERIAEFEARAGRAIRRRERRDLRDEVFAGLLPRALLRSSRLNGVLAPRDGWLAIDTASVPRAELFLDRLRDALGTLAATPWVFEGLGNLLARIVLGDAAGGPFRAGERCFLRDPAAGATEIRYRNADLADRSVRGQVEGGLKVAALELVWRDLLTLTVSDEGVFSALKLPEGEAADVADEDPNARLDADFAVTVGTLRQCIGDLEAACAGR